MTVSSLLGLRACVEAGLSSNLTGAQPATLRHQTGARDDVTGKPFFAEQSVKVVKRNPSRVEDAVTGWEQSNEIRLRILANLAVSALDEIVVNGETWVVRRVIGQEQDGIVFGPTVVCG